MTKKTQKGRQLFRGRKVHPQDKILATPMFTAVCTRKQMLLQDNGATAKHTTTFFTDLTDTNKFNKHRNKNTGICSNNYNMQPVYHANGNIDRKIYDCTAKRYILLSDLLHIYTDISI